MGSGKSTVAEIMEAQGFAVYSADYWAKWLMANNTAVVAALKELLGPSYLVNGAVDNAYVAGKIFSNQRVKEALEAVVHPAVAAHFGEWAEKQEGWVLKESALLFNGNVAASCDLIWWVNASPEVRMSRVQKRNPSMSTEEIKARMTQQNDLPEPRPSNVRVLNNNSTLEALTAQIQEAKATLK